MVISRYQYNIMAFRFHKGIFVISNYNPVINELTFCAMLTHKAWHVALRLSSSSVPFTVKGGALSSASVQLALGTKGVIPLPLLS